MTFDQAIKEATYISSINPRHPGPQFNHDPACFKRYCTMQLGHIRRHHPLVADFIAASTFTSATTT